MPILQPWLAKGSGLESAWLPAAAAELLRAGAGAQAASPLHQAGQPAPPTSGIFKGKLGYVLG